MKTKRRSFLQTLAGFAGLTPLASPAKGAGFCESSLPEADSPPLQKDVPGNERPSGKMAEEQVEIVDYYDDEGRLLQRTVYVPGSFVRNTTYRVFPH